MKKPGFALLLLLLAGAGPAPSRAAPKKPRLFVVSSYHKDYLWSQDTHRGLCAGLLDFGFLKDKADLADYSAADRLDSRSLVLRKAWMDTKRKNTREEMAASAARIAAEIKAFKPDLVLLGDDNATNLIGNQLIDTAVPVVFWGVDGNPMKYGLLDSVSRPGHNVTGVYQPGYYEEGMLYLTKLVPGLKTFAILSDDSETGRAKSKALEILAEEGRLPLRLVERASTNSFPEWQAAAARLQGRADAFFLSNHNTLKDEQGRGVDSLLAARWYLTHIKRPELSPERQFVLEGALIAADDSGYKQAYEAMRLAHRILHKGEAPGVIPVAAPARGAVVVNRQRAQMLGVDLRGRRFIEEYTDRALALQDPP